MFTHNPYSLDGIGQDDNQTNAINVAPFTRNARNHLLYEGRPVCLDHVKGVCDQKRLTCKFAHPDVSLCAGHNICVVYTVTGFCKFGAHCRQQHPPLSTVSALCAPACTSKMSGTCKDAALAAAAMARNGQHSADIGWLLKLHPADLLEEIHTLIEANSMHSVDTFALKIAGVWWRLALSSQSYTDVVEVCSTLHALLSDTAMKAAFTSIISRGFSTIVFGSVDLLHLLPSESPVHRSMLNHRRNAEIILGMLCEAGVVPDEFMREVETLNQSMELTLTPDQSSVYDTALDRHQGYNIG